MISAIYYLLRQLNIEIDPYDVEHSSFNLYDKESNTAFVFDGDASQFDDVKNIVIVHLKDEKPDERYYNYYVEELSIKTAARILQECDYNIDSSVLKSINMDDARDRYLMARTNMEDKYIKAIIAYLCEDDDHIFPQNGYNGLLCENWFRMQKPWYSIKYKFKGKDCELINDVFHWGDWGKYYSAALRYSIIYGSTTLPRNAELAGLKIRTWLGDQTTAFREGYLQPEREALLRNAGFKMEAFKENWDEMYTLLLEYKLQFGDTNIEKRATYKGQSLGLWCQRQRHVYFEGKLTVEKANKLESIGFVWDPHEKEWNRRYEQYNRYIIQHGGNVYIARRTDFENEHLGAWVETQRKRYFEGKVGEERINKLKKLGVDFEKWDEIVRQNS